MHEHIYGTSTTLYHMVYFIMMTRDTVQHKVYVVLDRPCYNTKKIIDIKIAWTLWLCMYRYITTYLFLRSLDLRLRRVNYRTGIILSVCSDVRAKPKCEMKAKPTMARKKSFSEKKGIAVSQRQTSLCGIFVQFAHSLKVKNALAFNAIEHIPYVYLKEHSEFALFHIYNEGMYNMTIWTPIPVSCRTAKLRMKMTHFKENEPEHHVKS